VVIPYRGGLSGARNNDHTMTKKSRTSSRQENGRNDNDDTETSATSWRRVIVR